MSSFLQKRERLLSCMDPLQLFRCCVVIASTPGVDQELLTTASACIARRVPALTPMQVSALARSFAEAGCASSDLLSAMASYMSARGKDFTTTQRKRLAADFAALRFDAPSMSLPRGGLSSQAAHATKQQGSRPGQRKEVFQISDGLAALKKRGHVADVV
jgi:hypothetical protein